MFNRVALMRVTRYKDMPTLDSSDSPRGLGLCEPDKHLIESNGLHQYCCHSYRTMQSTNVQLAG
jgi:hypothetical protein